MQVNIHDAKTQLSRLLEAVEAGEEVVIARRGKAIARLVPIEKSGYQLGALSHLGISPPPEDFFDPLNDEDRKLWEAGD